MSGLLTSQTAQTTLRTPAETGEGDHVIEKGYRWTASWPARTRPRN